MPADAMRKLELKEKEREEKRKGKTAERPEKARAEKAVKKWKGKDWYIVLAPRNFGGNVIAETPVLDPKMLLGRSIDVNMADLTGKASKFYMNLKFRINGIEGKNASTEFSGYYCLREHLFRVVRKRCQKVRTVDNVETKDNWKLQVTTLIILNRRTNAKVETMERKLISDYLRGFANNSGIEDFVKATINGIVQKHIRKEGSRIYPVRFSEIESIEVLSPGTETADIPPPKAKEEAEMMEPGPQNTEARQMPAQTADQ